MVIRVTPGLMPLAGVLVGATLLVSCGGGGNDPAARNARSPAPSVSLVSPSVHRTLEFSSCDGAWVPDRRTLGSHWRQRSTRIGPVRLLDATSLAKPGLAGRRALKIRVLFPPGRSITFEIDGNHKSRVGFVNPGTQRWSGARADLHSVLRIDDCPAIPSDLGPLPAGRRYGFGLFVGVRREACVPVTVTRNTGVGHRRVISFGRGDCAGDRS